MHVSCVSGLAAAPSESAIPGGATLSFDVQVSDDLNDFDVHYVIVSNSNLVRFAGGRPDIVVHKDVTAAMMTITNDVEFECALPNQQPTGFVAFTIEARVMVGNVILCAPFNHPAIRVTEWKCASGQV